MRAQKIYSATLLFFLLCSVCSISWNQAHAESLEGQTEKGNIPFLSKEREEKLDQTQDNLSQWLVQKATWFDSFFDDQSYTDEINETTAKIYFNLGYSQEDDLEIEPRIRVRLRLPHLENRAKLVLTFSEDDDIENNDSYSLDSLDTDNNRLSASFFYFLKEKTTDNFALTSGGSWDYLYAGIRYRYAEEFGRWKARFIDNFRYYTDDGFENKTSFEMNTGLTEHILFRGILAGTWEEEEDGISHSVTFRLYQNLSNNRAIKYETRVLLETEPDYYVKDYQISCTYRQRAGRDWLFWEATPFLTYPKDHCEDERELNPGILFKIEFFFGYAGQVQGFE